MFHEITTRKRVWYCNSKEDKSNTVTATHLLEKRLDVFPIREKMDVDYTVMCLKRAASDDKINDD